MKHFISKLIFKNNCNTSFSSLNFLQESHNIKGPKNYLNIKKMLKMFTLPQQLKDHVYMQKIPENLRLSLSDTSTIRQHPSIVKIGLGFLLESEVDNEPLGRKIFGNFSDKTDVSNGICKFFETDSARLFIRIIFVETTQMYNINMII